MVNVNIPIPDELHKQLKLSSILKNQSLKERVIGILEKKVGERGKNRG